MGLISVTSAQFWDKTEAARNSQKQPLSGCPLFTSPWYMCKEKNSKIILLTMKKKHPYKRTKSNTKENIILFVIFSRAGIKGEKKNSFLGLKVKKHNNMLGCTSMMLTIPTFFFFFSFFRLQNELRSLLNIVEQEMGVHNSTLV